MADDETKLIYVCPLCQRTSVVGPRLLGKHWNCRECGGRVVVLIPGANAVSSSAIDLADKPPIGALTHEIIPPAPFKTRLAQFLHCDRNELGMVPGTPASKMKFWSVGPFGPRRDSKPAWLIRMVLERIHKLVHGC